MSETTRQTLDQKRAAHAYETVQLAVNGDDNAKRKFKTQVKKTPARIMTSGLGPALAFLEAKRYTPELRDRMAEWIKTFAWAKPYVTTDRRLLLWVFHGSSDFLRLATAESLAYLQWVGRFTDAALHDVEEDGDK